MAENGNAAAGNCGVSGQVQAGELGDREIATKPLPVQAERRRLPNRRAADICTIEDEGHPYRVTFGHSQDGLLREIFLDVAKPNAALQAQADDAGVLCSLLLQHNVTPEVIRKSVGGPIAAALDCWFDMVRS
jgi:hypothetical protein